MKKILLPFEGDHYPAGLLELARRINTLSPVLLAAAFVPETDYARLRSSSWDTSEAPRLPQEPDEDAVIKKNSARLKDYCEEHGIKFRIHEDRFDFALAAIRKETRFADLLLLSNRHFFEKISDIQPNAYMKETLHGAECPVLLAPDPAGLPDELVLAYDGSPASVHAIRQFTYLFPELSDLPATLVYLQNKKDDPLPDEDLIEELTSQHFRDLRILKLHIRPEDFFETWMAARNNPWFICGSYGRPDLSRLFSGSFIARMIKLQKVPVFLAHR